MKLVLDTDVVVAAMRSPTGASAGLLRSARAGKVTLLASVPLAIEYEAACLSAEHLLAAGLVRADAMTFVDAVVAMAQPVERYFLWRPQLRDAGDEMVLETAINGRAEALVTFNVRHFKDVPSRFGIELMLPRDAMRRIEK